MNRDTAAPSRYNPAMPTPDLLPHDPSKVEQTTPVTTTVHKPGDPIVVKDDREANAIRDAEPRPEPYCYEAPKVIPSDSPEANAAARDNIVPSHPVE